MEWLLGLFIAAFCVVGYYVVDVLDDIATILRDKMEVTKVCDCGGVKCPECGSFDVTPHVNTFTCQCGHDFAVVVSKDCQCDHTFHAKSVDDCDEHGNELCSCDEPDEQFSREVDCHPDGSERWGHYYCGKCGKTVPPVDDGDCDEHGVQGDVVLKKSTSVLKKSTTPDYVPPETE